MSALSWMRSDPSLKVASVVLAVFVWMYVRSEDKPVQVLAVPLRMEGLPDDLAPVGRTLEHVTVRVRADEATLRELTPSRLQATVNLEDAQPGEQEVILGPEIVHAPAGVEVLSLDPSRLTLTIERRSQREVPVVVRFRGQPPPPLERGGYTVTPSKVVVQGPERIVRQVEEAVTEEVDLSGRRESFESIVAIQPDRGGVRILDKPVALVQVSLSGATVTHTLQNVPLVPEGLGAPGRSVRLQPSSITVVVAGPAAALARVSVSSVRASLNLEGMGPRGAPYAVEPRVIIVPEELGREVTVRSVSHRTIQVTISRGGAR
ncbi:MAG: CdaR family protein [Candidatus Polarisedimenticolia bacterium]